MRHSIISPHPLPNPLKQTAEQLKAHAYEILVKASSPLNSNLIFLSKHTYKPRKEKITDKIKDEQEVYKILAMAG